MWREDAMKYKNFGDFLCAKRKEQHMTVRGLAQLLNVSAPFLTDVEKDRRNPFEKDKLKMLEQILELDEDERGEMYNLAGEKRKTVPPDLPDYIMEREYVQNALRKIKDLDAGEEEWDMFVQELIRRKG